jgi:Cupin-like domain
MVQTDSPAPDVEVQTDMSVPNVEVGIEPSATEPDALSFGWRRWAAVSLLRGTAVSDVVEILSESAGISDVVAGALCGQILGDPTFEAARWAMGHLAKLESVLDMRQAMRELADPPDTVDRRRGLTRREFLEQYYSTNTPVLLEDVCDEWPARHLWSPQYLADRLGAVEVEVMAGRDQDSRYEINLEEHRTRMPFADYVERVLGTHWSNDVYLTANNHLLSEPSAEPLWDDFTFDTRYMRADSNKSETFLWFGPAGTVTQLHHDVMNILFQQVDGWKLFVLISPMDTHRVSNSIGVYSDVDPLMPDLDRFPRFRGVRQYQITVGPGEALFIPVGWWHHVTALEQSISVSSTSLVFRNKVEWSNPWVVL